MRIAYADPPYPGEAYLYGRREVDHARLVRALERFDGWALSTKSTALADLLPMCRAARVAAWLKGRGSNGAVMSPSYSWEPVIFRPARFAQLDRWRGGRMPRPHVQDSFVGRPGAIGFVGNKPADFCGWLFAILGCEPTDEFHDLFKGSGAVTRAWEQWRASAPPPLFAGDSRSKGT